jgi:hypothetical protein
MNTCIVCIAKNEDHYIDEWIKYHTKLGFDHIFIYTNDWLYESDNEKVSIFSVNGSGKQLYAYNDFVKNKSSGYDWAAFFDIDEYLVLKKHNNINSFLKDYTECDALGINWAFFGDNNLKKIIANEYSTLKRFIKKSSVDFIPNKHIKSIVKLPIDNCVSIHNILNTWCNLDKEKCHGAYTKSANWSIAQLNHYFSRTEQELYAKCLRGRADIANNYRKFEEHKIYLNLNQEEDCLARDFLYNN